MRGKRKNYGNCALRGADVVNLNHNRFFTHTQTIDGHFVTETLLSDSHASWRPAVDDVVWLLHNKRWKVEDVFTTASEQLVVKVVPA